MTTAKYGEAWRLLAHRDGQALEMENQGRFDELVVDDWLHVEQMEDNVWWLRVGDARLMVTLGDDGASIDVERGFYAEAKGTTKTRE